MAEVQLDELGQIALTVTDVARATAFYRDVLGMKFLFGAGTMAFFQCGAVRLMLGLAEQAGPVGGTILYFKVKGIAEVSAALEAKGVEFVQAARVVAKMPDHVLWMAGFKDLDGNVLELMEEVREAK